MHSGLTQGMTVPMPGNVPTTTSNAPPGGGVSPAHVLLFGGYDPSTGTPFDDTWKWDGSTWTQVNVPGPGPRAATAMATLNGKVVLFGGGSDSILAGTAFMGGIAADTWEWDGTSWTQPLILGPDARMGHAMATLGGKVFLFGGGVPSSGALFMDTWSWDGGTWTRVAVDGPPARMGHTMTTVGNQIVLYGGFRYGAIGRNVLPLGDAWSWDGSTWTRVTTTGLPTRYGQGSAALGSKLWIFGGIDANHDDSNELWSWDGAMWEKATMDNGTPAPRHAAAMTTAAGEFVLFGGDEGAAPSDGVTHEWNGAAWSTTMGGPAPRAECAMAAW